MNSAVRDADPPIGHCIVLIATYSARRLTMTRETQVTGMRNPGPRRQPADVHPGAIASAPSATTPALGNSRNGWPVRATVEAFVADNYSAAQAMFISKKLGMFWRTLF